MDAEPGIVGRLEAADLEEAVFRVGIVGQHTDLGVIDEGRDGDGVVCDGWGLV